MITPSSALGKSNRRLTDGSDEYSRVKLPNVVVNSTVDYYNTTRSHSRRDHLPPLRQDLPDERNMTEVSEIVCRERLGGLIKSFERAAA